MPPQYKKGPELKVVKTIWTCIATPEAINGAWSWKDGQSHESKEIKRFDTEEEAKAFSEGFLYLANVVKVGTCKIEKRLVEDTSMKVEDFL